MGGYSMLACFIILGTMSSVINCSPDHHHLFPKQQQVLHNRPILPTSRFSPSHPHGRLQRFHEGFRRSFRKPQRRLIGAPGRLFRKTPLNTKPFIPRAFKHPFSSFRSAPRPASQFINTAALPLRREFQAPTVQKIVPNFYYKSAEEIPGFSRFTLGDVVYTDI
eukprot:TRINITY_DN716_c0_g1_i1.p1 TRINITY_DN716_c0_g1~~TRINITY_DN716_c0_g1_i1.p1  ORF type:complete len:164 (-),score=20.87 TRINITY_DN716_c0_g1_i1:639-1130(-)